MGEGYIYIERGGRWKREGWNSGVELAKKENRSRQKCEGVRMNKWEGVRRCRQTEEYMSDKTENNAEDIKYKIDN